MKIGTEQLTNELIRATIGLIKRAKGFKDLSEDQLNAKHTPDSWSALECLEHLNLYGDFYNPEIEHRIKNSSTTPSALFKPGLIGNYFVKLMEPKEKLNRMKTFDDKNPAGSQLTKNVIDRFIDQQIEFKKLLEASRKINLGKTRTSISISKVVKIKLGDTFRFSVAHNARHLDQAERALNSLQLKKETTA